MGIFQYVFITRKDKCYADFARNPGDICPARNWTIATVLQVKKSKAAHSSNYRCLHETSGAKMLAPSWAYRVYGYDYSCQER